MAQLEGAMTALVTPFLEDQVDEKALRDLVERQIAGGIDALVPCGTTGESVTLSPEEHVRVVRIVAEQAKRRVPVVAGAGTNSTAKSIELARASREAGADALLLVCPYYNKPTQAGLEAHFRAIVKAVPLPSIVYNVPSRTSCDLLPETLARLTDVKEIVAVKEATGNATRSQQIAALTGDRFVILSGDDAVTLAILAVGGRGVVSVASNLFPREVCDVVSRFRSGDVDGARALQLRLLPVLDALFVETNPGPIKMAMADAGHIAPEIRLPLVWPSEASQVRVREAIRASGLAP